MEKINNKSNILLIISLTAFFFFWEYSIYNFQTRFLILLPIFMVVINFNYYFFKLLNTKLLILVFLLIHLLYSLNYNLNFYYLASFLFFTLISIITFIYKDFILIYFEKFIIFFLSLLSLLIVLFIYFNYDLIDKNYIYNFFYFSKLAFSENSHLGMILPSIIFFYIYKSIDNYKYLIILFFIFCFLFFVFSLTLFLGLILTSIVIIVSNYSMINKKCLIILISLIIFSTLSIFFNSMLKDKFVNSSQVISQLDINSGIKSNFDEDMINKVEPNLSIEVYITSLKIAYLSIRENPLGYGLNNYQSASSKYMKTFNVHDKNLKLLNLHDGSNNFSKIITEFGIFSFLILFFAYKFIFSKKIDLNYKFIILPNLITQTFLRGAGYFNGGYLILLLLLFFLVYDKEL
jgi:hypothetical protein